MTQVCGCLYSHYFAVGNQEAAAAPQHVAEELRAIGDQLEHGAVARATRNLSANLSRSNCEVSLL